MMEMLITVVDSEAKPVHDMHGPPPNSCASKSVVELSVLVARARWDVLSCGTWKLSRKLMGHNTHSI